jgi:cyclopropane fatty-acyl-phospholipid synthase-like methyltransferase
MKSLATATYNQRLFEGRGVRRFLHSARFRWLASSLARLRLDPDSVCELGCYDGKAIDYLPRAPRHYVGFDANWEGGLNLAAERWRGYPGYSFHLCRSPHEMVLAADARFDAAVVMETLEHLSPEMAAAYLALMARHTRSYIFITVPNEKGPLFLAKWLAKRLWSHDTENYTLAELCYATFGRLDLVARREHKGFDYARLIGEVSRHFKIVEVSGIPVRYLPAWMSFGIGIVGSPK